MVGREWMATKMDGMDGDYQGSISHFINSLDANMNREKLTYFQDQFSKIPYQ